MISVFLGFRDASEREGFICPSLLSKKMASNHSVAQVFFSHSKRPNLVNQDPGIDAKKVVAANLTVPRRHLEEEPFKIKSKGLLVDMEGKRSV